MKYTVSFDRVKSHYVTVAIDLQTKGQDHVDFKVPVWTPGSYKVREYSNAFERVKAEGMDVSRIDKNTWRIHTKGKREIHLSYDVYCFVVSVRQSYADEYYAYLHGVSAFGYIEGFEHEAITLDLKLPGSWKQVEVALPQTKAAGYVFTCDDYDLLADSPIAIGNFDTVDYVSGGVHHRVVMIGEGNYDIERIAADFKAISDYQVDMMGEHPSPQYVHFVYNVGSGGGGLEHQNSQCSMIYRWAYTDEAAYKRFLGLIAHEYFHLWNVKRIRPIELGPFEYDHENYTDMLWIAEGITSYYDDLTMYNIGKYTRTEYLNILASQINRYENTPGKTEMDLAESSKLAWVKGYLPKEESLNTEISYYNKGMIAAWLLDMEIRKSSDNTLADVLRKLYKKYYKGKGRGFTHAEFIAVCSKVAGKDLQQFFDQFIFSTDPIDYSTLLAEVGLDITNTQKPTAYSGISSKVENGKVIVAQIRANSPAVEAGLSVNDEIVSVDGWRQTQAFESNESNQKVGQKVHIQFSRDGKMYDTTLEYVGSPKFNYAIEEADGDHEIRDVWLQQQS